MILHSDRQFGLESYFLPNRNSFENYRSRNVGVKMLKTSMMMRFDLYLRLSIMKMTIALLDPCLHCLYLHTVVLPLSDLRLVWLGQLYVAAAAAKWLELERCAVVAAEPLLTLLLLEAVPVGKYWCSPMVLTLKMVVLVAVAWVVLHMRMAH